jgi:hypothetical protein
MMGELEPVKEKEIQSSVPKAKFELMAERVGTKIFTLCLPWPLADSFDL